MTFMAPLLSALGFSVGERLRSGDSSVVVNINEANGIAVNLWQAKGAGAKHPFEAYEPGLHHLAFNLDSRAAVDEIHALALELGAKVLDGPGEFPYDDDGLGYYAVYFLGPDRIKIECVHMPGLEGLYRERGVLV